MANVFGKGGDNCGIGGTQRVLPSFPDVIQSSLDFYTQEEIDKFLKIKADAGNVYDKDEVDDLLADVNSVVIDLVTKSEFSSSLTSLSQTILGDVQGSYYVQDVLYTKYEVDSLLAEVTTNPNDFVSKAPTSLLQNTINPETAQAISLTLVASSASQVDVVQQWIDHESNSIGRVRKSGQVEFYGNMFLGENIESWQPALDVSKRRIAGVANPIHPLDAVNKDYMEDYIVEAIDNLVQGDDKNYIIDALVY